MNELCSPKLLYRIKDIDFVMNKMYAVKELTNIKLLCSKVITIISVRFNVSDEISLVEM